MKKVLKVVILSILLILGMFIVNQKSEAVTLDMNYSFSNDENSQKNQKVKSGDEISIAITVNGEENGKIMAIFGYLYYDDTNEFNLRGISKQRREKEKD